MSSAEKVYWDLSSPNTCREFIKQVIDKASDEQVLEVAQQIAEGIEGDKK